MAIHCWFMKIMLSFIVTCLPHCADSLQSSQLQSYSGAIVVSVIYYKQHVFREKAVIVQSVAQMAF